METLYNSWGNVLNYFGIWMESFQLCLDQTNPHTNLEDNTQILPETSASINTAWPFALNVNSGWTLQDYNYISATPVFAWLRCAVLVPTALSYYSLSWHRRHVVKSDDFALIYCGGCKLCSHWFAVAPIKFKSSAPLHPLCTSRGSPCPRLYAVTRC